MNEIDNGTYGTVYKVENKENGKLSAIKLFESLSK